MSDSDRYIVDGFFDEVRYAAERGIGSIGASDIIAIAGSQKLRVEFRQCYNQLNDPSTRDDIRDYLQSVVNDLENAAEQADLKADLLDRVGLAPSAAITGTGIVAIVTASAAAAPAVIALGLVGAIACGVGRTWLKSGAQRNKASSRKVKQLLDSLKTRD